MNSFTFLLSSLTVSLRELEIKISDHKLRLEQFFQEIWVAQLINQGFFSALIN